MSDIIKIDETDIKILNMLIHDARTRLKDIAKECKTSSVSVLNRIKRMKNLKLITGATLFPNVGALGFPIVATMGINFDGNLDQEIIRLIDEQMFVVEPSPSVGEYDLCALVFAKSLGDLDKIACTIRERYDAKKVTTNVWSGPPQMNYENIDLNPKG